MTAALTMEWKLPIRRLLKINYEVHDRGVELSNRETVSRREAASALTPTQDAVIKTDSEITADELLERIGGIAATVREHADTGEQQRHLADPIVDALQGACLYHMLVPRKFGGLEVAPLTFYRVVEALARIDGSTGWCMFNSGAAPVSVAFLRAGAAEKIFGKNARVIMTGTTVPFGRAVNCPGGYRVSGRWPYASGCWHSTWHSAFCNVYEDGATKPLYGPSGIAESVIVHVPRTDLQLFDTWNVSGLCATGSHDVALEEVFVPESFAWRLCFEKPKAPRFTASLFRFPFLGLFQWPIAAVALGIAQAAIDAITEESQNKIPRLAAGTLREKPFFQTQMAQAVALVSSARAWLHSVIAKISEEVAGGDAPSLRDRAEFLLAATNATRSAASAVEIAYTSGGGSANYRKNSLQRQMRDMHAVTQHIGTSPVQYETSGRMLLGLPVENPFILL